MSTSAIVILRHACDGGTKPVGKTIPFNKNITFNNHGTYTKIDANNNVTIPINWLGELGLKQGAGLATALQTLLKDYCRVSRIVTEDTGNGHNGTSNPLHTISFYANTIKQAVSFDIHDGGKAPDPKTFEVTKLLQDGIGECSTVVCWEAMGMWRQEHGTPYYKKSILGLLGHCGPNGGKVNNYEQMKNNQPYKGQIIYIFECNKADNSLSLKMYNYDVKQAEGSQLKDITGSSAWPHDLCQDCEQHDVSQCK